MVLKKRTASTVDVQEPKKKRKDEKVEELPEKGSKKSKEYVVKVLKKEVSSSSEEEEDEEEEVEDEDVIPSDPEYHEDGREIKWPQADLTELFSRIEASIPPDDVRTAETCAASLDWDEIAFKSYSPAECKTVWSMVQKKIRRYRVLREILEDAREWVHKPWTNFYRKKMTQHPDMPKRPMSQYMLYFMEKKDKVAAKNPDLDMTQISKLIARMYSKLSTDKKEEYIRKSAALREEYAKKMAVFHAKHPEYKEIKERSKDKSRIALPPGLQKPRTPEKMFIDQKLAKLKDEPNFDKARAEALAKQQFKSLNDKKRLIWINWAIEEESKYLEALKVHMKAHPSFQPPTYKAVLKKEDLVLKDRLSGKPTKPPNSGYSLYSRIMLAECAELRELVPKKRMQEISIRWNAMPESEKNEYIKKCKYLQDKYKLEYATYLESLPEDVRQEELLKTQTKRKKVDVEVPVANNGKKANKTKSKKSSRNETKRKVQKVYFPGEPHNPPVNAYELFVESFVTDTKLSATEAPRFWEMLPASDKAKFQRKLKELKEKYIKDYKKFLKSLDEEQVAKYNDLQKRMQEANQNAEDSDDEEEEEEEEDDSDEQASSDEDDPGATNNVANQKNDSDSDENEEKKSDSTSDSSSSSSGSSDSSSSSDDSDSSSDDSDNDEEKKKTNTTNIKKENADSDSSDDE